MPETPALPTDIASLQAMILAERAARAAIVSERDAVIVEREQLAASNSLLAARNSELAALNARLESAQARLAEIVAAMRRARFGRKSERISEDQLALALEELEIAAAKVEAEVEKASPQKKADAVKKRRAARNENLDHLPHEEIVIEPEGGTICKCCNGALHKMGEDRTKRLDKQPAKLRVIVEVRPKYGCRTCERTGADDVAGVVQAPAPAHLIEGGLPTEALVADVIVSKHADHQPLYRQSQIMGRSGVKIERSTLAQWVGAGAFELLPLHDYLLDDLKASAKLFCDETRCPVLDPGAGKTKSGFLWALARDDRPWGGGADGPAESGLAFGKTGHLEHKGSGPPAVVYSYAPGRGGDHAVRLLAGFSGVLQVDGYAAYKQLTLPSRKNGQIVLAYCWSHLRRKFYELYVGGHQPIATEALARLKLLYEIEADIRESSAEVRRRVRQQRAKPVIDELKPWFEQSLAKVSKGSKLGEALAYGLNHWDGLCRYLDDGRIEIDSNTVERSIRGLALTRKNALFAGHDKGAEGWATCASLIETCKLNGVDPLAWMTDVLTKLVNRWPNSRIGELMPWAWAAAQTKPGTIVTAA